MKHSRLTYDLLPITHNLHRYIHPSIHPSIHKPTLTLLFLLTFFTFATIPPFPPLTKGGEGGFFSNSWGFSGTALAQSWDELAGSATGGGVSNNAGASFYPSLALDSSSNPHIAWYDDSGGDSEIYYAYWDGTNWTTHGGANTGGGVSNNEGYSASPSLVLDSSDNPHIAWEDNSGGDYEVYYAYWDGDSWETYGGANTGGGVSNNEGSSASPSLGLNSNGYPHITWHDNSDSDYEVYYAYWDGTQWTTYGGANTGGGVSNNTGSSVYPSLVLDNNGNPHIAWGDSSGNSGIYYAYWDGSNWVTHGNGNTGSGVSSDGRLSGLPSLALDSSGNPHIAWECAPYPYPSGDWAIYYTFWNGTSWVTHGGANTGDGVSNDGWRSFKPSLALDSSDRPHIALYDATSAYLSGGQGNSEIYYAYWDGSSWVTHGGGNTGGGVSNNTGYSSYPSLALDTSGNPHIAWSDYSGVNMEIYYRYWDPGASEEDCNNGIDDDGDGLVDCEDSDCVSPSVLEKPTGIKHVVIIDIDGLRPDKFEEELKAGNLHTFAEILGTTNYCNPQDDPNSHCIIVQDARTGFPSLTLPGHASIFTGCYINKHGIYGNNWLDRTSEQGKEGEGYHYLQVFDVATDFGLANSHLQADTIYEAGAKASKDFTAMVGFNFYIGSSYFLANKKNCRKACEKVKGCEEISDKKDKKKCKKECRSICREATKIWKAWYKNQLEWIQPDLSAKLCFTKEETNDYDRLMVLNVLDELRDRMYKRRKWDAAEFPNIVTLYFAAVDHEGHDKGTDSQNANLVEIDNQLGLLINGNPSMEEPLCSLKSFMPFEGLKNIPSESGEGTLFDDTVFVICADHGHSDVSKDETYSICYGELKDAIEVLDSTYIVGRVVPTEDEKRLKVERGMEPNVVLALNDGMAQMYVQNSNTKKWEDSPDLCYDIMPFARTLASTQNTLGDYILKRNKELIDNVSMILVKDRVNGRYKVFNGGNGCTSPLEELGEYFEDDEVMRINKLYSEDKSGDIVKLANYDDDTHGYYLTDSDWAKLLKCGSSTCCLMGADHGNINLNDLQIPFIIAGENVNSAFVPEAEQVDIAPTVADILGFEMPEADGTSIFQK